MIKRGEIYMCDLGEPVSHIQAGERPVIVVSNDTGNRHSPFVLVCPLTGVKKEKNHHTRRRGSKISFGGNVRNSHANYEKTVERVYKKGK